MHFIIHMNLIKGLLNFLSANPHFMVIVPDDFAFVDALTVESHMC